LAVEKVDQKVGLSVVKTAARRVALLAAERAVWLVDLMADPKAMR
jgi:hypothetical protein